MTRCVLLLCLLPAVSGHAADLGLRASLDTPLLAFPCGQSIKLAATTAMAGAGKDYRLLGAGQEATVVTIEGPAVIHRIWSTSSITDKTRLTLRLDGKEQVLWAAAKLPEGQSADALRAMDGQAYWSYIPLKVRQKAEFIAKDLRGKSGGEVTEEDGNKFYLQVGYTNGDAGLADADTLAAVRSNLADWLTKPADAGGANIRGPQQPPKVETLKLEVGKPIKLTDGPNWVLETMIFDTGSATLDQLATTRLVMKTDGSPDACVYVPLPYLFGAYWELKDYAGAFTAIQGGKLIFRFPIPEGSGLEISLQAFGKGQAVREVALTVVRGFWNDPPPYRLCAEYRSFISKRDEPLRLADIQGEGVYVGCTFAADGLAHRSFSFLEGNEQIYVDGAQQPTWEGTGAEDFFNAAWYFSAGASARAFHGCTALQPGPPPRVSAYRWLVPDRIGFSKSFRLDMQHGSRNSSPDTLYKCVNVWYAKPPCKVAEPVEVTPASPRNGDVPEDTKDGATTTDWVTPLILVAILVLAVMAGVRYLLRRR
jgi:hypothetical protein